MIICDNCKKNITPTDEEEISDRNILNLNGKKICLCTDCFDTLSDWACSPEHREKTEELTKEL